MSDLFGSDSRGALAEAVRAIESRSRAEVVVAIRPGCVDERRAFLVGAASCAVVSAFVLFSPWEFSLLAIWSAPLLSGALAAQAAVRFEALNRLVASRARQREAVLQAARATFVERGVGLTRERTGILVFLSQRERRGHVVADKGVTDMVPTDVWTAAIARVESALRGDGEASVLAALGAMGEVLARELPRRADDVNELPERVEAS